MPDAWSDKRERQYEHIKENEQRRGRSPKRAKEIAARTVNKTRREKGEVPDGSSRTQGTGNPNTRLEDRTRDQLENRAKELGIEAPTQKSKQELIDLIQDRNS